MSKTVGIVAEFNPFHNGHKALVDFASQRGYTHCISVMSGNFVQRGVPAITEKRVRTKAALLGGVDLVLELPLAYSAATAQIFALGSIYMLKSTGVVDTICFGSEEGETGSLKEIAEILDTNEFSDKLPQYLETGMTFASARSEVIGDMLSERHARISAKPNNLLAVEYLRAAKVLDWEVDSLTFARKGVSHHSQTPKSGFASASYLRNQTGNLENLKQYVPESAYSVYIDAYKKGLMPSSVEKIENAVLSYLRRLTISDLKNLPDISEGIENRLYSAIQISCSLRELLENAKTKRYTMARIRRLVLSAYLGIKRTDQEHMPEYMRILGFNSKGRELLAEMKESAELPFSHSLKDLSQLGDKACRMARLEALSTDLYTMSLPDIKKTGYDFSASGIFL